MAILSNGPQPRVIPGITLATPSYILQSARLANGMGFGGMGSFPWYQTNDANAAAAQIDSGAVIDPQTGGPVTNLDSIVSMVQKGIIALNAQQVFQLNLDRLQQGLPPIPTQYAAPTVNVGLAGVSPTMLLAGAALLIYLLLRKR